VHNLVIKHAEFFAQFQSKLINLADLSSLLIVMNTALEDQILQALRTVQDPDLKQDLVTLNMVRGLAVKDGQVKFELALTTPACPFQAMLKKACEIAIHKYVNPDLIVSIQINAQVTTIRQQEPLLPYVKNIIAVASGKGGVGKSVMASHLAIALAQHGAQVGLLDADIFGPSIPTIFGCEKQQPQVLQEDNKNYMIPLVVHGIKLLSIGFLALPEQAMVWRGPMASSALRQLLLGASWGELDYLLIDLPPGTSDIHLTLVQTVPVTGAIIITTPQKIALADAVKGMVMFQKPGIKVPILGVIENMAYFAPLDSPAQRYYLFGKEGGKKLAESYQVPFLGQVPFIESIREGGDTGMPAVLQHTEVTTIFKAIAVQLAQQIAIRNFQLPPTQRVEKMV
jgi:ATP-binding protein involved in chromosome partitioning